MTKELLSSIVSESIIEALFLLMEENEYKNISIIQLTKKAGVGRASFYRKFKDKDDVIIKYLEEQAKIWGKNLEKQDPTNINLTESLFIYFKSQERVLKLLYKSNLSHLMSRSLYNICGPKPEQTNALAYWNAWLAGGLFMWCDEWVKRGMKESPKEMAELINSLNNKQ